MATPKNIAKSTIVMPALGNSFYLGQLWDAITESPVSGSFLNREASPDTQLLDESGGLLGPMVVVDKMTYTSYTLALDDSVQQRLEDLNFSASLAMQFMGGQLQVSGAAAYIKTTQSSSTVARVSFVWSSLNEVRRLNEACKTKSYQDERAFGRDAVRVGKVASVLCVGAAPF
jgi:hypothetical protein